MIPKSIKKNEFNEGIVKAVGPGKINRKGNLENILVNVGDKLLLPEFGGFKLRENNEEFILIRDDEILAILKN